MAIFITVFIILLLLGIAFVLYACVVVGKASKTDKEIEDEKLEEIEYIKNVKKLKSKTRKINLEIKMIK